MANSVKKAHSGKLYTLETAPLAAAKKHSFNYHGIDVEDPWHWLRDPNYPKVEATEILDYLNQEKAYFDNVFAPHQSFVDELFEELCDRSPKVDEGVPFQDGEWVYQWRFAAEAQHRTWWRRPVHTSHIDDWRCILDTPALAAKSINFTLGDWSISPNGRYLAWPSDTEGSERFTIRISDLERNEVLADCIENTLASPVWSADSRFLLYAELNEHWRPFQIKAHCLETPAAEDRLLYRESSDAFWVSIHVSQSADWLIINAHDHETAELQLLPATNPFISPIFISPRRKGHFYDLDHACGRFWIRTNDQHKNFRLVSTADTHCAETHWEEEVAPSNEVHLSAITTFQDFYVLEERRLGLDCIRIRTYDNTDHSITFPEPVYEAQLGVNKQFVTDRIRLIYSSMVTPVTTFDYLVATRELIKRKVQQITSGYDASLYQCERLYVKARDAVEIPVSLVYHRHFKENYTGNLYLYGYGAYGHVVKPGFSAARLSMLERGYVCAIAHIRGGADLGHPWYEDGKLTKRTNTFNDFVDVGRYLVQEGYASEGQIAILGGSAGGELMGAVVNQAPSLWGAVVAHVPFVDVLNTMLDATLPLTPMEWSEWGNPATDAEAFSLIRSYSPYDQTSAQQYPPMLVTGGLNDPRVTYWEPAKWVAKLRHTKTDENILLLKIAMDAGHSGHSGRYDKLREQAEAWAFILLAMDAKNANQQ